MVGSRAVPVLFPKFELTCWVCSCVTSPSNNQLKFLCIICPLLERCFCLSDSHRIAITWQRLPLTANSEKTPNIVLLDTVKNCLLDCFCSSSVSCLKQPFIDSDTAWSQFYTKQLAKCPAWFMIWVSPHCPGIIISISTTDTVVLPYNLPVF